MNSTSRNIAALFSNPSAAWDLTGSKRVRVLPTSQMTCRSKISRCRELNGESSGSREKLLMLAAG